jgi:hypothetical protein
VMYMFRAAIFWTMLLIWTVSASAQSLIGTNYWIITDGPHIWSLSDNNTISGGNPDYVTWLVAGNVPTH